MRLIDSDEIRIKPEYMHDICGTVMIRVEDVARIINEMPTVNQWIPCEEFMPLFDFTDVIVVFKNGDDCLYDIAYRVRGKWSYQSDRSDGDKEPFAWMPLLEPWKEGNNEVE